MWVRMMLFVLIAVDPQAVLAPLMDLENGLLLTRKKTLVVNHMLAHHMPVILWLEKWLLPVVVACALVILVMQKCQQTSVLAGG
jgi:hypothetical protein